LGVLRIIENGAVLIIDGKIEEVGVCRRLDRLAITRNAEEIDATGRVVLPGFIDASVGLLCAPTRHDGAPLSSRVAEVRGWSTQRMELEARRRLRQFVRSGVTTMAAGCGYGLDETAELKALRALGAISNLLISIEPVYRGGMAVPPEFENRREDYTRWIAGTLLPLIQTRRLTRTVECQDWPELIEAATRLGFTTRVHDSHGRIRMNGVTAIRPGHPLPDGPVALTTGFDSGSSPVMGMQAAIWLACRFGGLSPEEAITAATINAAHALGVEKRVGSLAPGKDADLVILQTSDYRDFCWYTGASLVGMVLRQGREVHPRIERT